VVVTQKLVEWIFEKNETRLVVLGTDIKMTDLEDESVSESSRNFTVGKSFV
ncbi:12260_t:CDS:2, partial [Funneliformis geosporum]